MTWGNDLDAKLVMVYIPRVEKSVPTHMWVWDEKLMAENRLLGSVRFCSSEHPKLSSRCVVLCLLVGASLSEPHIDQPRTRGRKLCGLFTRVCPRWFPRSVYAMKYSVVREFLYVLTCVIYN